MLNIEEIRNKFKADMEAVKDKDQLSEFWQNYLGKSGEISGLMKHMKELSQEEKK